MSTISKKITAPKELNPNNRVITDNVIYRLFNKFGLKDEKIGNLSQYQLAFVHKSYVYTEEDDYDLEPIPEDVVPFQERDYERLEYIGDAILNAVVANYVFNRYPDQPEGFLTTLRTKMVRSNTLAKLTAKLKLHKYVLMSKHVEDKCNGRKNSRILEDIFESLIGAMFLDFGPEDRGWNVCQKFITNVFETYIDITAMIRKEDNYKRILLEYYQKKYHTEPKYQVISQRGPTNKRTYTMGALSPTGEIVGIGIARKKTDAEQIASRKALLYYGEDVDSESDDESSSDYSSDSSLSN